ncbi:MAG TPA: orotidine-5'-phosphate decarboxylase [Bryobacteraceae bacterium]|nr:orotidine-5'-phosphate decarboxylase [Bryobacteraceae bacterium]
MTHNPLIVALDLETADEARALVDCLGAQVGFYKVGMELYTAAGMPIVNELLDRGKDVFLDLKLYDIPETVKRAVAQVARTRVRFLTIHAVGSVMRAAVEGKGPDGPQLLAVTVLTSLGPADVAEMGYSCAISELVAVRTRQAMEAGVQGVITSPLEAAAVRRIVGPRAIVVTPGVRSAGSHRGDQRRVATPAEALRAGADYLVMGRQITRAADPASEALRVLEEIAGEVESRPA